MTKTVRLACLLLIASSSIGQIGYAQAPNPDTSQKYILKEGSDVQLKFAEAISSKTAQIDQRINFELDQELRVGDTLIAKPGAKAVGTVVHVKKAGMLGKGGELNVKLDYLIVGDNRIRLRATKAAEGDEKVGTAVALTVLFGPIGLIKHGKDIEIKPGSPLKGFVDQDTTLPASK